MLMTRKEALTLAISKVDDSIARDVLTKMLVALDRKPSDEAKIALSEKRKAETAQKRAEFVAMVSPIVRNVLANGADMSAKEIFEATSWPEGVTVAKVQNVLLREMASELVKTETKGKANTYRLAK